MYIPPGVVSQTPAFPGSLYLICAPLGAVIVITPVALAGTCLSSSLGKAEALDENKSALNANAANVRTRDIAEQKKFQCLQNTEN